MGEELADQLAGGGGMAEEKEGRVEGPSDGESMQDGESMRA